MYRGTIYRKKTYTYAKMFPHVWNQNFWLRRQRMSCSPRCPSSKMVAGDWTIGPRKSQKGLATLAVQGAF